ncbi:hypothetical protein F8M41_008620 [Gigaspora margarita]|uniref:F-box domain-containing protein n=4 Tax=Gigaspora margarita TaxID=4874 RepID=A0A8H3X3C5_GIGMA|nr:hypothetical protein F8M41_008620 [Gigaspora margarita]
MASKIFMGYMPELMENILNNLNNEFNSLYSCALVSRYWCKMSIPILWQDPFSQFNQTPLFITRYFSSLGEGEKSTLKKYGINAEFSKTLFEYARFLKILDLYSLEKKVVEWMLVELINDTLMNFIINLLFKLFIENGATLDKLVVFFSDSLKLKPEIFCLLEQNMKFFSRLQYLFLSEVAFSNIESAVTLLRTLAKNATKIKTLKLEKFVSIYDYFEPQLFQALFHSIMHLIKSQEQLSLFSLVGVKYLTEFHGIISALESQKNSLQEVIIDNCDFSAKFDVLNNCKNLETLRICYCDTKLSNIFDYKLSTLEIVNFSIDASVIVQILEKSGLLLQRLKLGSCEGIWNESLLLETLKSSCTNIKYLNITGIEFSIQLINLIGNLQKLQFLSLWCSIDDIQDEELKRRVMKFSEILPLTLQYLDLEDNWIEPYTDIFLDHCNAPLKKLLIYRLGNEKISKALIEFCIRNKTLNYVGVYNYLDLYDKTRTEMEAYVPLVPFENIIVDC